MCGHMEERKEKIRESAFLIKRGVKCLLALVNGCFESGLDFLAVPSTMRVGLASQLSTNAHVVGTRPLLEPESTGADAKLNSTEFLV
ncbi:hypothetical protein ES703_16307 [subsurface metagenome]